MTATPVSHSVQQFASIIAVGRMLTETQIVCLADVLTDGTLTLDAGVLTVCNVAGLNSSQASAVVTTMRHWRDRSKTPDALAAALLSALAAQTQMRAESPQVRLVWTGPAITTIPVRNTQDVLLELIDSAQHEIIVVGYVLSEAASGVIHRLCAAAQRGTTVVLIGNRLEEHLDLIRSHWACDQSLPRMYTRPMSLDDPKSALHAKLAIADQRRLLVTSANLTYHGLEGNIEIGVLLEGQTAQEAIELLNSLIADGIFSSVAN